MIVGIDLGTTNSLVAAFTEEGPVIIPNRLGKHLTPSVVSVDENGNVYVGETAQERRNLYPDSVAQAFKRSMGTDRTYDLSGKTIAPFCTSGGSGLSGTVNEIKELEPNAVVTDGLHIGSSSSADPDNAVSDWLEQNNIK